MFLLLSILLHLTLCLPDFYSPPSRAQPREASVGDEGEITMQEQEVSEELGADGDDGDELSLPPFTLLEFGYFDALRDEMMETQQFPFNPIEGQGREIAFDAQNGDALAQYCVGLSMVAFSFHDLDRVTQVRRSWLRQSAMQGYRPAQKLLALLYLNSAGAPRLSTALRWLNALALHGDAEAQAELLYLASQDLIEDVSPESALAELRAMAEDDSALRGVEARARYSVQLALGLNAALGLGGTARDSALALRYFSKARAYAMSSSREAVLGMGDFSPDEESLTHWERDLASLAQQGDAEACYYYALWLAEGLSADDEIEDAEQLSLDYMKTAASKGLAAAHYELACRGFDPWSDGVDGGLSKEQQDALSHYQQADALGCASAAAPLSRCYERMGQLDAAERVLRAAIARDDHAARENRLELASLLREWERLEEARELYESMAAQSDKEAIVQLLSLYRYDLADEKGAQRVEELLKQLEKIAPSRAHYLRNEEK